MTDTVSPRTEAPTCPRCGSRAVPIIRGMPFPDDFAAADRGEIVLAGCLVTPGHPDYACTGFDCGLRFS